LIEQLRNPISEDQPFGGYLKDDRAAYRSLRNAFNAGQTAYRAFSETLESLQNRDLLAANTEAWSRLEEAARDALSSKSKDIEVFVWYIAARIHMSRPLQGVLEAMTVLTDLVEADWDKLQPLAPDDKLKAQDDDGRQKERDASKLRLFLQLVGEVPGGGMLHLPLTNMSLIGEETYGTFLVAERNGELAPYKATIASGDRDGFIETITTLQALLAIAERLNVKLRSVAGSCGESPVPLSHLTGHLNELLRMFKVLSEGVFPFPGTEVEAEEAAADEGVTAPSGGTDEAVRSQTVTAVRSGFEASGDSQQNRESALETLADLARYFRTTEPHSPLHLLLDRALRWSRMPITELYAELLGEGSQELAKVSLMAGLESFEHSGKVGSKKSAPIKMPTLDDYKSVAPSAPAVSQVTEAPNENTQSNEPTVEPSQTDEPAVQPIKSFEW
jgi:type VI secretion system protein ImpA